MLLIKLFHGTPVLRTKKDFKMQFENFLLLLRSLRSFEKSLFHRNLIMYILVFHIRFYLNVTGSDSKNFLFYLGNIEETHKHMPLTLTDDYIAGTYYMHNSYFFRKVNKICFFSYILSLFQLKLLMTDGLNWLLIWVREFVKFIHILRLLITNGTN